MNHIDEEWVDELDYFMKFGHRRKNSLNRVNTDDLNETGIIKVYVNDDYDKKEDWN